MDRWTDILTELGAAGSQVVAARTSALPRLQPRAPPTPGGLAPPGPASPRAPQAPSRERTAAGTRLPPARGRRRWVSAAPLSLPHYPFLTTPSASLLETPQSAHDGVSHRSLLSFLAASLRCAPGTAPPSSRAPCLLTCTVSSRAPCAFSGFAYRRPGSLPSPVSQMHPHPLPRFPHRRHPLALDPVCQAQGRGPQGDCPLCLSLTDLPMVGGAAGLVLGQRGLAEAGWRSWGGFARGCRCGDQNAKGVGAAANAGHSRWQWGFLLGRRESGQCRENCRQSLD